MSQKHIRFSINEKEYKQIVKASVATAKATGKLLSIHQFSKKKLLEALKNK